MNKVKKTVLVVLVVGFLTACSEERTAPDFELTDTKYVELLVKTDSTSYKKNHPIIRYNKKDYVIAEGKVVSTYSVDNNTELLVWIIFTILVTAYIVLLVCVFFREMLLEKAS